MSLLGADDPRRPPNEAKMRTYPQFGATIDLPKQDGQLPMNLHEAEVTQRD